MNRSQGLRRFRAMWRWHSRHPRARKHEYPGWKRNGGKYEDHGGAWCFLCGLHGCGDTCAVIWPGGNCMASESPYTRWQMAYGKQRGKYALQISKLPRRVEK